MGAATTYGPENLEETRTAIASAIHDIPEQGDPQYGTKEEYLLAAAGRTLCREIADGAVLSQGELQAALDAVEDAYHDELGVPRSGLEAEEEFLQAIDARLDDVDVRFYEE